MNGYTSHRMKIANMVAGVAHRGSLS